MRRNKSLIFRFFYEILLRIKNKLFNFAGTKVSSIIEFDTRKVNYFTSIFPIEKP